MGKVVSHAVRDNNALRAVSKEMRSVYDANVTGLTLSVKCDTAAHTAARTVGCCQRLRRLSIKGMVKNLPLVLAGCRDRGLRRLDLCVSEHEPALRHLRQKTTGPNTVPPCLARLTGLQDLRISGGILVECAILRGLTNLQTLHLAWRTSRIVVDLAPALERLTALRELVVGDLDIDCAGLAEVLQRVSPGLRTLKLRRTKDHRWSHKGIDDAVALGIARLTNLCELDLTYSYMGPDGAAALAPALRLLLSLRSLDLALNCLGKGGAEAIAPALSRLTALTSLSFYKNDLGPDGVAALAPAISQCHGLATIDASSHLRRRPCRISK